MSTIKHGGPAFPAVTVNDTEGPSLDPFGALLAPGSQSTYSGMTLRDYFAVRAMQGYLTGHIGRHGHEQYWSPKDIAAEAYAVADAMLRAREGGAA